MDFEKARIIKQARNGIIKPETMGLIFDEISRLQNQINSMKRGETSGQSFEANP